MERYLNINKSTLLQRFRDVLSKITPKGANLKTGGKAVIINLVNENAELTGISFHLKIHRCNNNYNITKFDIRVCLTFTELVSWCITSRVGDNK